MAADSGYAAYIAACLTSFYKLAGKVTRTEPVVSPSLVHLPLLKEISLFLLRLHHLMLFEVLIMKMVDLYHLPTKSGAPSNGDLKKENIYEGIGNPTDSSTIKKAETTILVWVARRKLATTKTSVQCCKYNGVAGAAMGKLFD